MLLSNIIGYIFIIIGCLLITLLYFLFKFLIKGIHYFEANTPHMKDHDTH